MTLPLLDAMRPLRADADVLRRVVSVETNMGILPQFFFPEKAHRDQLTAFSGTPPPSAAAFGTGYRSTSTRPISSATAAVGEGS
jgi:hypothetical protein